MKVKYKNFRDLLIDEAKNLNLQTHSIKYQLCGPYGEALSTDIIHTQIDAEKPTFIYVSGCHGIEGYLGSMIQRRLLNHISFKALNSINLIIVHALNPYGMAWYRRVNSNNVDLNRNFFLSNQRPENKNFEHFLSLMRSENLWEFGYHLARLLWRHGYAKAQQVVVQGQYDYPNEVFYGGIEVQDEIRRTLSYLSQLLHRVSDVKVIDVHAGLGHLGKESVFAEIVSSEQEIFEIEKVLKSSNSSIDFRSAVYKVEGGLANAFAYYLKGKKITYLVQEIGTAGDIPVFYNMVQDNLKFNSVKLNEEIAEKMVKAFFPPKEKFQQGTVEKALKTFVTLINHEISENKKRTCLTKKMDELLEDEDHHRIDQ